LFIAGFSEFLCRIGIEAGVTPVEREALFADGFAESRHKVLADFAADVDFRCNAIGHGI
jgi:hypothetical protein